MLGGYYTAIEMVKDYGEYLVEEIIYVHYGSTVFDSSKGFPIRNDANWSKPHGGLWASRQNSTFGWKTWCEQEEFRDCDEHNSFKFRLHDNAQVAVIHNMKDLRCLPTIKSSISIFCGTVIDFEECVRQGYDAIELCWYGNEYNEQKADDMYFGLYGWDCDSIVVLNPLAIIPI